MAPVTLLLELLILVSSVSASRHRHSQRFIGGSLTFTPKGRNSDGTYEVELRNKQTHPVCYQNSFTCLKNCGTQTSIVSAIIGKNSYNYNWCQNEVVMRRKLQSNLPFEIRYPKSRSTYYGYGYWVNFNFKSSLNNWNMMAHVDLGTRSDTHESNKSPIIAMSPVLRLTRNCPRVIHMTVFDHDGDRVRCRYAASAKSPAECNMCSIPTGFSLDQDTCSLSYSPSSGLGYQALELVVEDFPRKHINVSYSDGSYTSKDPLTARSKRHNAHAPPTTPPPTTRTYRSSIAPLSKIPLQFAVYVQSYTVDSCLDGDYLPIFLSPTPSNGVNLPAFVNNTLEIKIRSTAQYTTICGLIITGPKGISKQKTSTEEYTIKWTPTDNEVNDHFPICFVSEAKDKNNRVYHSELRCVTADVGRHETIVHCNETAIRVEVEKSYLIRRNEDHLHLKDFTNAACNLTTHSNSTHLVAIMSLNTCGTTLDEDGDNLVFRNEITSADPTEIISRQHDVEIAFSCVYPKRTNLTLGFRHKNPYAFTEKGFGSFSFQFEFFESKRFRKQKEATTYPVEVYLKQMIFMQIESTTSIPNTQLFVENCKATPYDNPNSRITYTIIENGCVKDSTVQVYPGSRSQFRFGMEAFEFIGAHEEVYITCSVVMCEIGVPGTRCTQGCLRSNTGNQRHRREAVAETAQHSISQGPLHLIKTSDSQASGPNLHVGMNLMFLVGCLLLCGVVVYRSRRSKAKYQRLPTSDSN